MLRWAARRTRLVLPAGILLGLIAQPLAAALNPLLGPAVALLLVAGMMRVEWPALRAALRRPLPALLGILWLCAGLPLLVLMLTLPLGLPAEFRTVLVMVAAMPPILSGPALAGLLGLDAATALVVMVVATLASPLTLAVFAGLMDAGSGGAVEPLALLMRMGAIVGGSVALALVLRRLLGPARLARRRAEIDGMGVVLLLAFAVAVMDGMAGRLIAAPGLVLLYALAAFALNLGMQAVTRLVFRPAGPRLATTLAFLGGNRNAALLLTVLPAEPALVLYVAAAQFPIYLLPSLLMPLYRRLAAQEGP
ncbi:hypothetical protein [Arenibaculum pallidiluteum]|uniref:hypothetical protein n=1 Tax=Arenibaculum pallidiluteum TaxID=2812559 RepID=UPI001A9588F3|nr:hypothetical protein [Arenibaculum pallidiluteum]